MEEAVMEKERNLGVTEARFALTLLTCLLVAIGYVALLRLGGSKDTTMDLSPDDGLSPSIVGPLTTPPKVEPEPRVLPLDKPEDGRSDPSSMAKRPISGQHSHAPERH
jgi:hypothetical protein